MIGSQTSRRSSAFRIAFVAAIGGFLFGYDLGMISAANIYLEDQFKLNEHALGWATSSAVLGCVFGPLLGAFLCDRVGRKRTMIMASLLLAISAIFTAIPDLFTNGSAEATMRSFNIFRFVGGIGVGLCSIASPMYIAELSPPKKRGQLGLMYQLAIVGGNAIAPLVGVLVAYILRTSYGIQQDVPQNPALQAWRWLFFSETICVLLFVLFVLKLPNSPRWLAKESRFDEAKAVLAGLGGEDFAVTEMKAIRESLQEEEGDWSDLFGPGIRYALLIGMLLAFFNNWTGWSVIGGYLPRLFEAAGFDREAGLRNTFFVLGAMGVLTLISISLTDRVGRRPLWNVASFAAILVTFCCGMVFHLNLTGWMVLLMILLCTIPHGLALGGLPWLMMSELYPTKLRAKAVAVTTTILWSFIFAGTYLFPTIEKHAINTVGSTGGAFWLFSIICVFSLLFGLFVMPETKGRSLEEIANSWK